MGQKINPISIRIGITRNWSSNWFTSDKKAYKEFLHEDLAIRTYVKKKFFQAGISKLDIESPSNEKLRLVVYCSKPGLLIGRKGADIDYLKQPFIPGRRRAVFIEGIYII